jgi:hypothetical protein
LSKTLTDAFETTQEFVQQSVPGNGHCLFASFCIVLRSLEIINIGELRKKVADFNRRPGNIDEEVLFSDTGKTLEQYCDDIERTNRWGGEAEIRAVAKLYDITVRIIEVNEDKSSVLIDEFCQNNPSLEKVVYIIYVKNNHYEALYVHHRYKPNEKRTIFNRNDSTILTLSDKFIRERLECEKNINLQ